MNQESAPTTDATPESAEEVTQLSAFMEDFEQQYAEAGLYVEIYGADDKEELSEVADLDKEIFGEHKSLSAEDFEAIAENGGFVTGIRNKEKRLIAEASLILENNPEHGESQIERALPEKLAYCDGAAVHPSERGKGLQKKLLQAREIKAYEAGKENISASVRHRNLPSIKSMMKEGYVIVANAPHYYGETPEDSRIFMAKQIGATNPLEALRTDHEKIPFEDKGVTELEDVDEAVSESEDVIALEVENSDEVDETFNEAVGKLLDGGYVGVTCHEMDVGDGESKEANAMVFVRLESLDEEPFTSMAQMQKELKDIFQ